MNSINIRFSDILFLHELTKKKVWEILLLMFLGYNVHRIVYVTGHSRSDRNEIYLIIYT